MKKWIRWQGFSLFLLTIIILCLFWFMFIDGFIKRIIEKNGTKIVGAKVELDNAEISVFPMGLKLEHLRVTNPDEPMKNAIEIERISMSVDTMNILRRKMIIDDMTLGGIRLNTPRKVSGAISKKKATVPDKSQKSVSKKSLHFPSFNFPDLKEILEKEDLESIKLIELLQTDISNEEEQWKKKLGDLPDKDKVSEYKKRIEKIKTEKKGLGSFMGAAKDIEKIQKEIKSDLKKIKGVQEDYKKTIESLKNRFSQIEMAPQNDFNRLKQKYTPSIENIENFTQLFLGEKMRQWIDTIMIWYERVKPVLNRSKEKKDRKEDVRPVRGKGIDVHFKENEPLPDFLIRQAKVSLIIQAGDIEGTMKNITSDQDILRVPLTFLFLGEKLQDIRSIKIDGILNHISPEKSDDQVTFNIKGYQVKDVVLSDKNRLPVTLKKGLVDLELKTRLFGKEISSQMKTQVKSAELFVGVQDEKNQIASAMGSALSDISGFTLNAQISGTLDKIDIKIRSDLDNILNNAVGKLVKDKALKLEGELKTEIFAKVDKPLKILKESMEGLNNIDEKLTSRSNILNNVLEDTLKKTDLGGLKLPF